MTGSEKLLQSDKQIKPLRYLFALFLTRMAMIILRSFKKPATHVPGIIAIKICPDFIKYIDKPTKIIGVTGTNGKTTTANMIGDLLTANHLTFSHNKAGSNIQEGIVVALLDAATFWGKRKSELMVLEIDERVSLKIYPYLKPSMIVITNLFRDSYKRNAHVDFIFRLLSESIPEDTTLILNADDVISSSIKPQNNRVYFGIDPQKDEQQQSDSLIHDARHCPSCDFPLHYTFDRYHHIGRVNCSVCGFTNPKADYVISRVNKENKTIEVKLKEETVYLDYHDESMTNLYNKIAAIATVAALGLSHQQIIKASKSVKVVSTRLNSVELNNKKIILMMAKDQNPIAVSRVFDIVKAHNHESVGILLINENSELGRASENMAWYYDADFTYLNQPHIKQVIAGGYRYLDFRVRCLLAGINATRIDGAPTEIEAADCVDFDMIDTIFVLYGTKTFKEADQIKQILSSRLINRGNHS